MKQSKPDSDKTFHVVGGPTVKAVLRICFAFLLFSYGACDKEMPQAQMMLPSAAEEALLRSPQQTLFSLDPESDVKADPGPRLQGFRILGQTAVGAESRQQAVRAVHDDIARWNGKMSLCFYPRHAIRATHSGTNFDFLICYECGNLPGLFFRGVPCGCRRFRNGGSV